ncbi:MAG TPA: type II toxin-antitoxin system RelE/ParE family toxin [Tepidisphaeraceae bacterium]|nr:type II toxin-antitoxin system RelE/ParE family toxin [Tepidisphaeraceae bacterium]
MAFKIVWSPEAVQQLHEISEYIARDSTTYAAGVILHIIEAAERLADHPRLGRRVPEWDRDELREVLSGNYRIIYRVGNGRVDITDVMHGAQQLRQEP